LLAGKAVTHHHDLLRELSELRVKWQKASVEAQKAKRVIAEAENADAAAEDAIRRRRMSGMDGRSPRLLMPTCPLPPAER
jgi:hypothetical protein